MVNGTGLGFSPVQLELGRQEKFESELQKSVEKSRESMLKKVFQNLIAPAKAAIGLLAPGGGLASTVGNIVGGAAQGAIGGGGVKGAVTGALGNALQGKGNIGSIISGLAQGGSEANKAATGGVPDLISQLVQGTQSTPSHFTEAPGVQTQSQPGLIDALQSIPGVVSQQPTAMPQAQQSPVQGQQNFLQQLLAGAGGGIPNVQGGNRGLNALLTLGGAALSQDPSFFPNIVNRNIAQRQQQVGKQVGIAKQLGVLPGQVASRDLKERDFQRKLKREESLSKDRKFKQGIAKIRADVSSRRATVAEGNLRLKQLQNQQKAGEVKPPKASERKKKAQGVARGTLTLIKKPGKLDAVLANPKLRSEFLQELRDAGWLNKKDLTAELQSEDLAFKILGHGG